MDPKRREELLQMTLPGGALLLLYVFLVNMPMQRSLTAKQKEVAAARAAAVTEHDLLIARNEVRAAESQLASLKGELVEEQAKIDEIVKKFGGGNSSFEVLQRITELCRENRVSLVSQNFVEKPKLSKFQQNVLARVESQNERQPLEYRAFTFQGSYGAMVKLLAELDAEPISAFPVSLELSAGAGGGGEHTWQVIMVL